MTADLKTRIINKLDDHPFLRMLVLEFWFRMAFLAFVFLLIFLGLFLPKMWKVSPPEFEPPIRISGLDWVQAWSLKRSALQSMAQEKHEEASYAWQSAIGNYPTNPDLLRGSLRNLQIVARHASTKPLVTIVRQGALLLRLAATNQADVELLAHAYESCQAYDFLYNLVKPFQDQLNPSLEGPYLKALFQTDHVGDFAVRWERAKGRFENDAELKLYHAAYLAGWGPAETAEVGRRLLASAMDDTVHGTLATRLQMAVSTQLGDIALYQQGLKRLEQVGKERLIDQIGLWRLLLLAGRKAEAKELAQSYTRTPTSAFEAVHLASAYVGLGMDEYARQFLQKYAPRFNASADIWLVYSQALLDSKKWDELRELTVEMRQYSAARDKLIAYSYYLEGRAELAQGRHLLAETAFQKIGQFSFEDKALGFQTAIDLMQLGYMNPAQEVLLKLEKGFDTDPMYWHRLGLCAHNLKQPDVMLRAWQRAFELKPGDPINANNYAAALLVQRSRPEEVIKLTLQRLTRDQKSLAARINHAFALLLSHRAEEAKAILSKIDSSQLNPQEATSYHLALFETCLALQQYPQAKQASERIDRQFLFPSQVRWLEQMQNQIPHRIAGK